MKIHLILLIIFDLSTSWWCAGHMLIFQIALDDLISQNRKDIVDLVNKTMTYINKGDMYQNDLLLPSA